MRRKKRRTRKILISLIALIVVVAVFYFAAKAITKFTGYSVFSLDLESFAKCLGNNARMYGAFWCEDCQNQKKMFGENFKFISYIECSPRGENPQTGLCIRKGISNYPAWEINNKIVYGEKSLKELSELSNCKL